MTPISTKQPAIQKLKALAESMIPTTAETRPVITVDMVNAINMFFDDTGKNMQAHTDSDNNINIDDFNRAKRYPLTDEQIDMLIVRTVKHIEDIIEASMKDMLK